MTIAHSMYDINIRSDIMFTPENKCNDEIDETMIEKHEFIDFKHPDDPGDFMQSMFLKYMLHSECSNFKEWGCAVFENPNHKIFELAEFSNDLCEIRVEDNYIAIVLYEKVCTDHIEELPKYGIGALKWGIDESGYIYSRGYSDKCIKTVNEIDINAFRFIKRYEPLYRIFKYLYKLDMMVIDY